MAARAATGAAVVELPPLAAVVAWAATLLDAHFVGLAMQPAGRAVSASCGSACGLMRQWVWVWTAMACF